MPDITTVNRLTGLIYSAVELKETHPEWSNAFIEDYLNILDNFITISQLLDVEIDQKLEEVPTDFDDGVIPFVDDGFLVADVDNLFWDAVAGILNAKALIIDDTVVSRMLATDGDQEVSSVTDLTTWVTGSDLQTVVDDLDGTVSHNDDNLEFYIQAVA
ncbi:unnamed protein product [marine sediment metagenome]|uniref:Uncharacterized protein n=1 Tax=marine sediment metagenome TaxID=412755 RepID=X1C951_9ZZZZ